MDCVQSRPGMLGGRGSCRKTDSPGWSRWRRSRKASELVFWSAAKRGHGGRVAPGAAVDLGQGAMRCAKGGPNGFGERILGHTADGRGPNAPFAAADSARRSGFGTPQRIGHTQPQYAVDSARALCYSKRVPLIEGTCLPECLQCLPSRVMLFLRDLEMDGLCGPEQTKRSWAAAIRCRPRRTWPPSSPLSVSSRLYPQCVPLFQVWPRAGFRSSPERPCGLRHSCVRRESSDERDRKRSADELPCKASDKRSRIAPGRESLPDWQEGVSAKCLHSINS